MSEYERGFRAGLVWASLQIGIRSLDLPRFRGWHWVVARVMDDLEAKLRK
jgi:hypothetical protein